MHHILEYLVGGNHSIDRACFWAFVAALVSIASTVVALLALRVAWVQLKNIDKTSRADFLHRFTENFFKSECHKLLMLFDFGMLIFKKQITDLGKEYVYFETIKATVPSDFWVSFIQLDNIKDFYPMHEIDELLGYLEDIGNYESEGLLDIRMVYEVFGSYIEMAWQNEQLQKYIEHERNHIGKDMYDGFENIYKKVIAYKKIKCISN